MVSQRYTEWSRKANLKRPYKMSPLEVWKRRMEYWLRKEENAQ